MYTIVNIPNKGKGMKATTAIPLGTRILAESPLLKLSMNQDDDVSIAKPIKDQKLSREDIRTLFSLQNNLAGSSTPLSGIARMNAINLGSRATATQVGIFKYGNRVNHSCLPNAYITWNAALGKLTVHAIRDIKCDEEITISYGYEYEPYASRQAKLEKDCGLKCICERCMKPLEIRMAADGIFEHLMELEEANIAPRNYFMNSPEKYLTNLKVTIELLVELRMMFTSLGFRTYHQAFKVAIAHGDEARASVFAQRAFETRRIMEGEDNPEAQLAKTFAENPASHPSHGKLEHSSGSSL